MWQLNVRRACFCAVPHSAAMLGHQASQHTAFSTRPRVRERVMMSLDACTSGNSRVLTVASLQRLKMEVIIPAHADCEARSMIKFLNTQSTALIEIHRQLYRVYGHTWPDGLHISCRSSAGRCLFIIHPVAQTSCPLIWWGNDLTRSRRWFFVSAIGSCVEQKMVEPVQ